MVGQVRNSDLQQIRASRLDGLEANENTRDPADSLIGLASSRSSRLLRICWSSLCRTWPTVIRGTLRLRVFPWSPGIPSEALVVCGGARAAINALPSGVPSPVQASQPGPA